MSNNIYASTIAETNPIVVQLEEFGYDSVYSRRVFYYLHPENLEEALNYMAIENGIIQHRFVNDRNISNSMCYICGEKQDIHLKEFNINDSINENIKENDIQINIEEKKEEEKKEDEKKEEKEEIETNSKKIQNTISTIDIIRDNIKQNFSSLSENIGNNTFVVNSRMNLSNSTNNICNTEITEKKEIVNIKNLNKKKEEKKECPICEELFIVNNLNKVEKCGHAFCPECWYDSLSIKIKENKLSSIKCLDYNCKEILSDDFIINLLNSDTNLIKKYNQYKLELEIIKDPNKKLCPYPNCDSYLELKEIMEKNVTCKNNHTFCFICLKKPHGNLPCNNDNLDKSMIEYATNNFVKKCPKCSIITEKNKGCNHITCTKCGYQWCWLCNEKYEINHFTESKCKGFQFFQPKNDYEINLMMEGKINAEQLAMSQRQFDEGMEIEHIERIEHLLIRIGRVMFEEPEENLNDRYNRYKCSQKFFKVLSFLLIGNWRYILMYFHEDSFVFVTIYLILNIPFFFHLLFLNLITFIFILIFSGFKTFIVSSDFYNCYIGQFILILANIFFATYCLFFRAWCDFFGFRRSFSMLLSFFTCIIITNLVLFPHIILVNIIGIIITFFCQRRSFSRLLHQLDNNLRRGFGFWLIL